VSATEYAILELLSLRKGTILTKEMFLDRLYRGMNEPQLKIIDVFLCKCAKSSPGQRAAITTSKRCGAAAICSATRRTRQPKSAVHASNYHALPLRSFDRTGRVIRMRAIASRLHRGGASLRRRHRASPASLGLARTRM
jgi:hypothetical protein